MTENKGASPRPTFVAFGIDGVHADISGLTVVGFDRVADVTNHGSLKMRDVSVLDHDDHEVASDLRSLFRGDLNSYGTNAKDCGVPACCPDCGFNYLSSRYNIMNARFWAQDSVKDRCPMCGSYEAHLLVSLLDFTNGVIEILQAPQRSKALIEEIIRRARSEIIKLEDDDISDPRFAIIKDFDEKSEPWTRDQKLAAWSIALTIALWMYPYSNVESLAQSAIEVTAAGLRSAYEFIQSAPEQRDDLLRVITDQPIDT